VGSRGRAHLRSQLRNLQDGAQSREDGVSDSGPAVLKFLVVPEFKRSPRRRQPSPLILSSDVSRGNGCEGPEAIQDGWKPRLVC
jgi:hypothetical protein